MSYVDSKIWNWGLNLYVHIYSFAQIVFEKKQGSGNPNGTLEEFNSQQQNSDRES